MMENRNTRVYSLDAARGIAAISVMLFHLYSGKSFFQNFYLFVDFFFVLSGFVLAPTIDRLSDSVKLGNFLRNRFVRLFPMAYSAIIFIVVIQLIVNVKYEIRGEYLSESIPLDPITLLASFLFLQVFSVKSQLLLYPLWSLSSEWLTNILAGSFYLLSMLKKSILTIFIGVTLIGVSLATDKYPTLQNCTSQVGRGLLGFGLGLLAWKHFQRQKIHFNKNALLAIVIIAPLVAFFLNSKLSELAIYVSPLMFTCVVLSLNNLETEFCTKPPALICEYLGRVSYGVYVWHVIATNMVALVSENLNMQFLEPCEFLGIPRLILALLISIACTEIVLKFIEAPIRKRLTSV